MASPATAVASPSVSRDRSRSSSPQAQAMSMNLKPSPQGRVASGGAVLGVAGINPGGTKAAMPPKQPRQMPTNLPLNGSIPGLASFVNSAGNLAGSGTVSPGMVQCGTANTISLSKVASSRLSTPDLIDPDILGTTMMNGLPGASSGGSSNKLAQSAGRSSVALHGDGHDVAAGKVAAFLNKLFSMINDSQTDALIYWAPDGKSFFIPNSQEFGRELLPQFFKHANFTSFVRQLNMYGFKKVPHLQAGALTSIPSSSKIAQISQATELWEFSNPKFMRSRPELLASITRKRSAKEVAAAQALAVTVGDVAKKEELMDGMDVDGSEESQLARQLGISSGRNRHPDGNNTTMVDPQALNKALEIMHSTHTAMEEEITRLKSSNEMLWRQALRSQKEQAKSQKRLEGVVNFLATKFGGMGVAGLSNGDDGDSARLGQKAARAGRARLIGDGVTGLAGSDDEDGMDQDDLWENGDPDEGKFWELDDKGNEVKRQDPRITPARPTSSRPLTTPIRRDFPNLPPTMPSQAFESLESQRFERLDMSPEAEVEQAFDNLSDANMGTPSADSPFAADTPSASDSLLFPPVSNAPQVSSPSSAGSTVDAKASSALTIHQHGNVMPYTLNDQNFALDQSILQMPLGLLLSNPAGAQLLATLGNMGMSAQGMANTEQGAQTGGGNTVMGQTHGPGSSNAGSLQSPKMSELFDLDAAEEAGVASEEASHASSPEAHANYENPGDWLRPSQDLTTLGVADESDPMAYDMKLDSAFGLDDPPPVWTSEELSDFLGLLGDDAQMVSGFPNGAGPHVLAPGPGDVGIDDTLVGDGRPGREGIAMTPPDLDFLQADQDALASAMGGAMEDAVEGMPAQIRKKRKTDQR